MQRLSSSAIQASSAVPRYYRENKGDPQVQNFATEIWNPATSSISSTVPAASATSAERQLLPSFTFPNSHLAPLNKAFTRLCGQLPPPFDHQPSTSPFSVPAAFILPRENPQAETLRRGYRTN